MTTGRTASADPTILKWLHDQFLKALPFLQTVGMLLDADEPTPRQLAELIVGGEIENNKA